MNEFWNNYLSPGYYDKIFKKGEENQKGIQPNWHRSTFLKISSLIKTGQFHLDYACGPGTFTGNFVDCKSVATDISQNQIDYATKTYGTKSEFIKLEDFNFESYIGLFDSITLIGLLEFIDDETTVSLINKLHNLLKNEGILILSTPNYGGLMYFLELFLNKFGRVSYKNQHINRHSKVSLNKVLNKTEFSEINIQKHINFGIFSSFLGYKVADNLMNFIDKAFNNFFGFIFIVELKK